MRTVEWREGRLCLIDQRLLPGELQTIAIEDVSGVARAIQDMAVRGAPAIGVAAAFGLALAARHSPANDRSALLKDLEKAAALLRASRPTAVNLPWALERVLRRAAEEKSVARIRRAVLAEAQAIADEDVAINRRIGQVGAALIPDGATILHHCNTGALATVDYGTALGVIRTAHEQGKRVHVLVKETRPQLQGARLTAWELKRLGIPFTLIADSAAGHFLYSGHVDITLVGADRVAANGDVVNKIGTYEIAVLAQENGIPFYPCLPTSTIDLTARSGRDIPIEERPAEEITGLALLGRAVTPEGVHVANPAFDITPYRYVTGIITEKGIAYPPFTLTIPELMNT